ncbi:MAG: N-acetylmuramoyl-L-alanine amidase [Oscillospiraceae bacterium]|nr:N-acetylmuramoyl-L-alanine amidase [Oscillospiraceae bacterium]
METKEFLRRYAYVYCYVAAFFLVCAGLLRHTVEVSGQIENFGSIPVIVIDAGHGSPDGGATGVTGAKEDKLNLQIAKRLEALLSLMGYETVMTRTTDDCIATEGDTIQQKKMSDLRNRVALINALPAAVVVSIHQNHFPDGKYAGPQVFYAGDAEELARTMQESLSQWLSPGSKRAAKKSSGVYLMQHIRHPGILVECGFLSNSDEERKLRSAEHQKKIAAILAAVLTERIANTGKSPA